MEPITLLGLALCLGVLFQRARKARNQPRSSPKKRFDTAHLLIGALVVWLIINFNLQHLNSAFGGEPPLPASTWERVIRALSDWI